MRDFLTPARRNLFALAGAWAVLMWVVFATRPLMPIDELRYAAVAWEMWLRGDPLVPHLNGQPYSHKPPLLFWLIDAGWMVFGVSETWLRLVAPLFGLFAVLAMPRVFRLVWPDRPERAAIAPWILFGSLLWTVVGTVTMFDMLNALFALGAVAALVSVWRGKAAAGWAAFGLCVGLGILAKGPVILVYTLPPLLLAPWWLRGQGVHWWRWAAGGGGALGLGAAVALAWAIPAGFAGGDEYRAAILWGQTAGRVSESFAHARAIWWYLPLLPLALFPWLFWPRVWQGLGQLWRTPDPGLRLCIAWGGGGLVILSLISGKQPHYLVPLLPAFALAVAATLPAARRRRWELLVPGAVTVLAGAALAGLVAWIQAGPGRAALDLPEWAANISILGGLAVAAGGAIAIFWRQGSATRVVAVLGLQSLVIVVALHLYAIRPVAFAYDVRPAAVFIREAIREGRQIAFTNEYHGQLHFPGRIDKPFRVLSPGAAMGWGQANPRARIVMITEDVPPRWTGFMFVQPYRGRILSVWTGDTLSAYLANERRQRRAAEEAAAGG